MMKQRLATIIALALLLASTLWDAAPKTAAAGPNSTIEVDLQRPIGAIRSLQGVNNGPITPDQAYDLSTYYTDIGVDWVRLHDLHGSVDIHWVFPDFDADPTDPENYDFTSTDLHIGAMKSIGADIIYRLGYSWGENAIPPSDYDQWASICVHIIEHYNDGWANGFHHNITYWEIWNEPDIPEFWVGTPEEYFHLYEVTANAIKDHDPNLKVGGPALAMGVDYLEDFLKYCGTHDVPLDFVSWHIYGWRGPYDIYLKAEEVENAMETYGFSSLESFLTEWNEWVDDWQEWDSLRNDPEIAAFTASELIYLQDSSTDIANYYRGDTHVWGGMFNHDGTPGKAFYAFKAFKMLLDTPNRVYCSGSDTQGYATIAGISDDGRTVTVLVSDFDSGFGGYDLSVQNLPWEEKSFTYQRYIIDETRDLELVESKTLNATDFSTTEEMESPSVHLIRLEAQAVRDVAVMSVTPSPTEATIGENVTITVVVENNSSVAETFDVSAYYDTAEIDTQTVTDLAAGAGKTLTFAWDTSGIDAGGYTIKAVATLTGDSNTANNALNADETVTVKEVPPPTIPWMWIVIGMAVVMVVSVVTIAACMLTRRKP
jgi:xylan 1,4-beta-xylosidase